MYDWTIPNLWRIKSGDIKLYELTREDVLAFTSLLYACNGLMLHEQENHEAIEALELAKHRECVIKAYIDGIQLREEVKAEYKPDIDHLDAIA